MGGIPYNNLIEFPVDVRNIKMEPIREAYYVDDQINCTAEGNPRPDVKWVPVKSQVPVNIGPILQIVNAMSVSTRMYKSYLLHLHANP